MRRVRKRRGWFGQPAPAQGCNPEEQFAQALEEIGTEPRNSDRPDSRSAGLDHPGCEALSV